MLYVHSLGGGGRVREGNQVSAGRAGVGGLCYIFLAGNRVMIDFKCYFLLPFFYFEECILEFKKRCRLKWVCTNFNIVFFYIGVKGQEAGGI